MLIPSYVHILTSQKPHIPAGFNMCLVISKCVTAVKVSNFSGQYLRNHWTLDIGVLGYIVIVWPKEHPPEVLHIPPGTPCIRLELLWWWIFIQSTLLHCRFDYTHDNKCVGESENIQTSFLNCCVGYTAHCAYRNFWLCGLNAWKIRVIMWKNNLIVQNQIIVYCFKTIHSG